MSASRFAAPFACVLLTALLALVRPSPLAEMDLRMYDALTRASLGGAADSRVAIVAIDDASLAALGQWPWPRDVIAALVDRLTEMGASAIALDVLFAETDRGAPALADPTGLADAQPTDAALADALARSPSVASYAFVFDASLARSSCAIHPLDLVEHRTTARRLRDALFDASGVVCSLGSLTSAAGSSGFINAGADADGLVRRAQLLITYQGRVYPSLALAAVRRATALEPPVLEERADRTLTLRLDRQRIGLDERGNLLVRYRGESAAHISAADVIAGRVPASALRGRVIFVGVTALGQRDMVATPLQHELQGVEVHAAIADSLLGGVVTARPVFGTVYELLAAVVAGLVVVAIGRRLGLLAGTVAAGGLGLAGWWAAVMLLESGVYVSPFYPAIAMTLGLLFEGGASLTRERKRGDREHKRRGDAQRLIVQALTTLTETRDSNTGLHARRTQEYTRILAAALARRPRFRRQLTPDMITLISTLAPLHDIGKVGVSDAVLRKAGALTPDEVREMRRHPGLGHESLLKAEALAGVHDDEVIGVAKEIVHTHHEYWDGTGYPQGLRGEEIPISGRIVALVDVYDAMVEDRSYHKGLSPAETAKAIIASRGQHFDPDVVDAFITVQDEFRRLAESERPGKSDA